MMKAILVDDELYCTEVLSALLTKHCPEVDIIAELNDPHRAVDFIRENPPDLLFLDIEMPRLNGFDLLERVRPVNFQVIFTTAYNQYALRAIKISALDYLLKPIDAEELINAIKKAQQQKSPQWSQFELMEENRKAEVPLKTIALSTMDGLHFVEVEQIIYCRSEGSYTQIHFLQGDPILLSKPIRELEDLLSGSGFLRVHHSYMINLSYVKKYLRGEGGEVVLKNGHQIPISRNRKAAFLERITKI